MVQTTPLLVVCRGFSEGGSFAFGFGDDFVGGLGPGEWLGGKVPAFGPFVDLGFEVFDRVEAVVD